MSSDSVASIIDPVGSVVYNDEGYYQDPLMWIDPFAKGVDETFDGLSLRDDAAALTETAINHAADPLDPTWTPQFGGMITDSNDIVNWQGGLSNDTFNEMTANGGGGPSQDLLYGLNKVGDVVAPAMAGNAASAYLGAGSSAGAESGWNSFLANDAYGAGTAGTDLAGALGGGAAGALDTGVSSGAETGWNDFLSTDGNMYSLGGETYTPQDLPFNSSGTDIGANSGNWSYDAPSDTTNLSNAATNNVAGTYPAGSEYSINTNPADVTSTNTVANTMNTTALDSGGGSINPTVTSQLDTGGTGSMWEDAVNAGYGSQATAGYNPSSSSTNLWDTISNTAGTWADKAADQYMKSPIGNTLKAASALSSYLNSQNTASALQKARSATDPFASQRSQYQNLLQQSYLDPKSLYNSKEYQSLQDLFLKDLRAKDAAAGRNSQYASRSTQAQNYFNTYLNNYRAGLQNAAGTQITPGSNYSTLATGAAQQNKNAYDSLFGGLNSIFGNASVAN